MINTLKSLVISLDFISEKPQLLLNGSNRSKTLFGGALSLLPLICICIALFIFGFQMLNRTNSTLTYNQIPVKEASFDYGQFPFMVALLDNGIKLINEEDRYYSFLADIWNFIPDNSTGNVVMKLDRVKIQTEKCNINKHFGIYKDYFKNVPYLDHHYCALPGQNITIYGIYGSIKEYNFLDFWISTCVNDTSLNRTNCYSREESKARLVNTYISYQYLDYFIDHSNVNNPGQLILRSQILPVSSTIYKRDFFYIKNINYFTDLGYIFPDLKLQTYDQLSSYKETVDLRPQGTVPGSFALISIMMDNNVDQYERRFIKFQEVLAVLGGLFKGLCVIAYLINTFLFDEIYYSNIISGIFKPDKINEFREKNGNIEFIRNNIKHNKGSIKNSIIIGNSMLKFNDLNKNSKILNQSDVNNSQLQNNLKQLNLKENNSVFNDKSVNKINLKPNDIQLSYYEMLFGRFMKRNSKLDTYRLAKSYTERILCIKNLLFKLNEISKLKCFVFNQEQLTVFNSIKTPSYYNLHENTFDIWEELIIPKEKQKEKELISNFKSSSNFCTDIDQKFMNIIKLVE